jgi:hypothetical protein
MPARRFPARSHLTPGANRADLDSTRFIRPRLSVQFLNGPRREAPAHWRPSKCAAELFILTDSNASGWNTIDHKHSRFYNLRHNTLNALTTAALT